jgi:hypothetical protein
MTLKSLLKKLLLNRTINKEYLCVPKEKYDNSVRVFIQSSDNIFDITDNHAMLGYKPLVFLINSEAFDVEDRLPEQLFLSFRVKQEYEIAKLELKKIEKCKFNCYNYSLYYCEKGFHKFSSPMVRSFQHFHYFLKAEREKNVFLKGNLFNQVKIAYSLPRKVSLISLFEIDLVNIFPVDLIGKTKVNEYFISLRAGNKSNNQIKKIGKIALCRIESSRCTEVYGMGKNHMKDMLNIRNFSIESEKSELLNYPLPLGTIAYSELERIDSFEYGIHEIHLLRLLNSKTLKNNKTTLAHIHRDILEWRLRRNIPTEFILH